MNGWAFQENAAVTENLGDLILALLKHGTLEAMICQAKLHGQSSAPGVSRSKRMTGVTLCQWFMLPLIGWSPKERCN